MTKDPGGGWCSLGFHEWRQGVAGIAPINYPDVRYLRVCINCRKKQWHNMKKERWEKA